MFKIISALVREDLVRLVSMAISDGWACSGSPFLDGDMICQAMMKPPAAKVHSELKLKEPKQR